MLLTTLIFITAVASEASAQTYKISFRNRTPQTLTSPVCAIHSKKAKLFTAGTAASEGLAELAEDGSDTQFAKEVRATRGVKTVKVGGFTSGNSRSTLEISSTKGRRLSCVFGMLVVTNDAFPAMQGLRLPKKVGQSRRFRAKVYDAGSETNTESCDHVPGGPCDAHFIGEAENGVIQEHPGLQGIADIDVGTYGWTGVGVRGRVTRME